MKGLKETRQKHRGNSERKTKPISIEAYRYIKGGNLIFFGIANTSADRHLFFLEIKDDIITDMTLLSKYITMNNSK